MKREGWLEAKFTLHLLCIKRVPFIMAGPIWREFNQALSCAKLPDDVLNDIYVPLLIARGDVIYLTYPAS